MNECSLNTDNCDANAACTDTEGSFTCTCNPGYTGDGITCTSESTYLTIIVSSTPCYLVSQICGIIDNCDVNAACTETTGTFSCSCIAGFTGDGVTCQSNNP